MKYQCIYIFTYTRDNKIKINIIYIFLYLLNHINTYTKTYLYICQI